MMIQMMILINNYKWVEMIPIFERKLFYNCEEISFIVARKFSLYLLGKLKNISVLGRFRQIKSFYSCENCFTVAKNFFIEVSQVGPGK